MSENLGFLQKVPLALGAFGASVALALIRLYLLFYSSQFAADFQKQNYLELTSQNTMELSRRIQSLSSSVNWRCIVGQLKEQDFYRQTSGDCETGILQQKVIVQDPTNKAVKLEFTLALPTVIARLSALFVFLQVGMIVSLIYSTRKAEQQRLANLKSFGELALAVAHDLRSPLTALKMISSPKLSAEERENLIEHSVARIGSIADEMLDRVRGRISELVLVSDEKSSALPVREGPGRPDPLRTGDVSKLIRDLISVKRIELEERPEIRVSLHSPEHGKLFRFDAVVVSRVVSNLINNAVESIVGAGFVSVSVEFENDICLLQIRDSGSGIPAETLAHLFQPGFTLGKVGGNGLGLSSAKSSLEAVGGKIRVSSEVGRGTTVRVELPVLE